MAPAAVAASEEFAPGTPVVLAGYGTLGIVGAATTITNTTKQLYETTTVIEGFDTARANLISYRSPNGRNSACAGDSGGPMFIQDRASGELKVIGATRGPVIEDNESLRCVGRGTYTNAAYFKSWIEAQMVRSAE